VRVLFDQGTPEPLRRALTQHEVVTAYERGWSKLTNGELLDAAEKEGFDAFVTTDVNLKHQQNLASRRIAIVASQRQVGRAFSAPLAQFFVQLNGRCQGVTRRSKFREQDG